MDINIGHPLVPAHWPDVLALCKEKSPKNCDAHEAQMERCSTPPSLSDSNRKSDRALASQGAHTVRSERTKVQSGDAPQSAMTLHERPL